MTPAPVGRCDRQCLPNTQWLLGVPEVWQSPEVSQGCPTRLGLGGLGLESEVPGLRISCYPPHWGQEVQMKDLSFLIWKVRITRPALQPSQGQISKGLWENIKGCALGRGFHIFSWEKKKRKRNL